MRRRLFVPAVAALAAGALLATPTAAGARILDNYCEPSGKYCISVEKQHRTIKLRLGTFSFKGRFELCVQPAGGQEECQQFRLRRANGGIYRKSVNWARHFEEGRGTFKARWFHDGSRVGPALSFEA